MGDRFAAHPQGTPRDGRHDQLGNFQTALLGRITPASTRKEAPAKLVRKASWAVQLNEHIAEHGDVVFRHACKLGFEGVVSKRLGSPYRSGRSRGWLKIKYPNAPAVKREAEEDWGR